MKKRSSRYDINRPTRRHGYKYTKCKMCLSVIMVICIKPHLSHIWSSIHEKFSDTECTSRLAKISVFPFLITMAFFDTNTSVEVSP